MCMVYAHVKITTFGKDTLKGKTIIGKKIQSGKCAVGEKSCQGKTTVGGGGMD